MQPNATSRCEDNVPLRSVCDWEELSHWDLTKAKAAMVIPRLHDSNLDTQSPEDGLLMVVRGCVNGKDVTIMIDSEAMCNFIALQTIKQLQLSMEENWSTLELVDGSKFIFEGKCLNVLFTM